MNYKSDRCEVFGRIVDRREMAGDQTWGTQQHSWQKVMQPDGSTLYISPEGQQWTEAMMAATAKVELTPLGYDINKAIQSIPEEWGKKGIKVGFMDPPLLYLTYAFFRFRRFFQSG